MSIDVQSNIPLAPRTTFKVGGRAAYFVAVHTDQELLEAIAFAHEHKLKHAVLGGGSNVLVSDTDIDSLVIHIAISGREVVEEASTVLLTVGAGEVLDATVAYAVSQGWWGMENLSHIPGSVGAVPVQNVGAYGVEAQDIIASVRVLNTHTKEFQTLAPEDCAFGYRDSVFKHAEGEHLVITHVTFRLSKEAKPHVSYRDLATVFSDTTPSLSAIREEVVKIRATKFPDWISVGTAGSFFKNPIIAVSAYEALQKKYPALPGFMLADGRMKVPLGWILDKVLNLKGYRVGNVEAYKNQALVLVAHSGATANEIEQFANSVIQKVFDATGIAVEWEVTQWK